MPSNPSGYLRDICLAPKLASDMQAIEPQRMKVLTADELKRYGLN